MCRCIPQQPMEGLQSAAKGARDDGSTGEHEGLQNSQIDGVASDGLWKQTAAGQQGPSRAAPLAATPPPQAHLVRPFGELQSSLIPGGFTLHSSNNYSAGEEKKAEMHRLPTHTGASQLNSSSQQIKQLWQRAVPLLHKSPSGPQHPTAKEGQLQGQVFTAPSSPLPNSPSNFSVPIPPPLWQRPPPAQCLSPSASSTHHTDCRAGGPDRSETGYAPHKQVAAQARCQGPRPESLQLVQLQCAASHLQSQPQQRMEQQEFQLPQRGSSPEQQDRGPKPQAIQRQLNRLQLLFAAHSQRESPDKSCQPSAQTASVSANQGAETGIWDPRQSSPLQGHATAGQYLPNWNVPSPQVGMRPSFNEEYTQHGGVMPAYTSPSITPLQTHFSSLSGTLEPSSSALPLNAPHGSVAEQMSGFPGLCFGQTHPLGRHLVPPSPLVATGGGLTLPAQQLQLLLVQQRLRLIRQQLSSSAPTLLNQQTLLKHERTVDVRAEERHCFYQPDPGSAQQASSETVTGDRRQKPQLGSMQDSSRGREVSQRQAATKRKTGSGRAKVVPLRTCRPHSVLRRESGDAEKTPLTRQVASEPGLAPQERCPGRAAGARQVTTPALSGDSPGHRTLMDDYATHTLAAHTDEAEAFTDCRGWVRRSVRRSKPSARVCCSECGERVTECECSKRGARRKDTKKRRRLQEQGMPDIAVKMDAVPLGVLNHGLGNEVAERHIWRIESSRSQGGEPTSMPSPLSLTCEPTRSPGCTDSSTLASSPSARTERATAKSSCRGGRARPGKGQRSDSPRREETERHEVVAFDATGDRRSSSPATTASSIRLAVSGAPAAVQSLRKIDSTAAARPDGVYLHYPNTSCCRLKRSRVRRGRHALSFAVRSKASSQGSRKLAVQTGNKGHTSANYCTSSAVKTTPNVVVRGRSHLRRLFSPAFSTLVGLSGLCGFSLSLKSPDAFLQSLGRGVPKTSLSSASSPGDTSWRWKVEEEQESYLNALTEAFHKAVRQVTQQGAILLTAAGSQALPAAAAVAVAVDVQQNEDNEEAQRGQARMKSRKRLERGKAVRSRQGLILSQDFPGLVTTGAVCGVITLGSTGSRGLSLPHDRDVAAPLLRRSPKNTDFSREERDSYLQNNSLRLDDEGSAQKSRDAGSFRRATKSEMDSSTIQHEGATRPQLRNSDDVQRGVRGLTYLSAVEGAAVVSSGSELQGLLTAAGADLARLQERPRMTADSTPAAGTRGTAGSRELSPGKPKGGEQRDPLSFPLASREEEVRGFEDRFKTGRGELVLNSKKQEGLGALNDGTSSAEPCLKQDRGADIGTATRGGVIRQEGQAPPVPFAVQDPVPRPMDGGQKEVKTEPSPLVCQGDTARDGSRSGGETRGEGDRVKTQENTGARSVIDEAFCVLCAERQTSTPEELLEKPGPNEELRIPCAVAFSRLLAPPEEGSSRSLGTTSTPLHAILAISWCGSNSSARELLRAVLIGAGCCLFACTDVEGFYFCRSSGCFSELLRSILALQPYLPRLVRQGEEKKVSADAATQCMVKRADPVGLMEKGVEGHTVRQFVWGAVRELGGVACAPPFSKKQRAAWRSVMKKQIFQDADIRCLSAAIAAASASSEGQWLYVSRAAWLRQACAVQRGLHFAPGIEHASLRSCQLLRDGVELVRNVLTADAVASLYSMIMKHFELLMDRVLPVHREWPFSPPNSSLFKYNGIACRNSTMRVDVNLSEAHWEWGEGELRRRHLELQRQVLFLTRLAAAHIAQRFGTWRRGPRQAGGSSPMLYTSAGASSERSENDSCSARAVSEGCTPDAASAGGTAGGCAEPDSSLPEKSEKNETENECESQGSCDEKAEGKIPEEGVWRAITFGYIISIGPHSNDQKVHHDYHQEAYERNILNAFFPLVDITPDNSATTFLICGKKLLSCAGAGDMILMDNVVRHYGSSHVASTIRPLIYCSLADRRTTDTREPVGKKTHFYNWHQYPPLPSPCRSTAPETTPQVSRADKTANRRPQRVVFETLQDTQEETARRCFENGASAKTTGSTERQHGHQQESGRAGVGIERLRGQDWSSGAELDSPRSASHTTVLAGISRTLGENEESPGEKQESDESASLVSYAVQLLESNTSCHRGPECGDQRTPYAAKESARIRYMCPAAVKGSMDNGEAYTSEEKGRTFPSPGRENQPVGRLGDRNGGWEEMRDSSRCDERNFSRARNGAVGAEEGSLAGGFTRQVGGDGSEGEPHTPSSSGCTASNTGEGPTGSDAEKKASEVERGEGDPVVVSEETERQRAAGKEKSDAAAKAAEASRPVAHAGPGEQSTGGLPLYLRHVLLYRKHVATCGGASRKKAAV